MALDGGAEGLHLLGILQVQQAGAQVHLLILQGMGQLVGDDDLNDRFQMPRINLGKPHDRIDVGRREMNDALLLVIYPQHGGGQDRRLPADEAPYLVLVGVRHLPAQLRVKVPGECIDQRPTITDPDVGLHPEPALGKLFNERYELIDPCLGLLGAVGRRTLLKERQDRLVVGEFPFDAARRVTLVQPRRQRRDDAILQFAHDRGDDRHEQDPAQQHNHDEGPFHGPARLPPCKQPKGHAGGCRHHEQPSERHQPHPRPRRHRRIENHELGQKKHDSLLTRSIVPELPNPPRSGAQNRTSPKGSDNEALGLRI